MAEEKNLLKVQHVNKVVNNGGAGAIYGLGVIGALIYYLQHATTFLGGIVGIIKAIFWPAVLVYEALKLLHL